MKWRRWALVLHRDLGYFFAGVVVIYAISGLAVNHAGDWNPNFSTTRKEVMLVLPRQPSAITNKHVVASLRSIGETANYKSFDFPSPKKIKIYLADGSIMARLSDGRGIFETIRPRPFFCCANLLHLNPKKWWLAFSDVFAVCLILIVLTGLLIPKGRKGLAGRGKWFVGGGMLIPLAAIVLM